MKNRLAIYLAMLMMAFVVTSCFNDDDDTVYSPYAMMTSFGIGDLKSQYPTFTSTGADTFEVKTIKGVAYPFSINQTTCEVYNSDSLPFATKVDKVTVSMELTGSAMIYDDSLGAFEYFSTTDSLDFTSPRKIRITSPDGEYYRDYTVNVNVHQQNPDVMAWKQHDAVDCAQPLRTLEHDGSMCLFGKKDGQTVFASTELYGAPLWHYAAVAGLPATANLATVQSFGGALYVVAADGIYTSANGADWSLSFSCDGALAIVGASDSDCRMWVATADELLVTADGVNYESAGALPAGFPVYGVSIASYAMNHNKGIIRYMLVGYTTEEMDGNAVVWSKLSTENRWARYENGNNPFPCPSLKGLTVVRYDDSLYALGGAGVAEGKTVEAFSSFYISRDNGITWKSPDDFYQRMPADLQGYDAPFVVTVDSNNVMWIVCAGDRPMVWKGIVNRLGFRK